MYTAIPSKFTSRHKWATLQLWTGRQTAVPHYLLAEEKKQAPGWRDGVWVGGGGGGQGLLDGVGVVLSIQHSPALGRQLGVTSHCPVHDRLPLDSLPH